MEMSVTFSNANDRMLAKNANSIAARPRWSEPSASNCFVADLTSEVVFMLNMGTTLWLADQLTSPGRIAAGHGQPCRGASAVRQNAACSVDCDVVHDHDKAGIAVARLVDGAAERDT